MISFSAIEKPYSIVSSNNSTQFYPLLREDGGKNTIYCISPCHGRSFILKKVSEYEWIIGKGNGLSYSSKPFILTSQYFGETWGGLSLENALRDYNIGNEICSLGVLTNKMDGVLELDSKIVKDGKFVPQALLQYKVRCPYRITDFPFIPQSDFPNYIKNWDRFSKKYDEHHLIAAEVLIRNIRTLHDNGIIHNAIHAQNYTWALELVDFESSRSNNFPYDNCEYEKYVPMLKEMEILQTIDVINYIAWCLGEKSNAPIIDSILKENGFELTELNANK